MAYSRGTSANIIVGAAALFTYEDGPIGQNTSGGITNTQAEIDLPNFQTNISYKETLSDDVDFRNVGYTMNGLEIVFQPDFGGFVRQHSNFVSWRRYRGFRHCW